MNRKLKKLIKNPGVFFRDYLNKKYPQVNCEQKFTESEERAVQIVENRLQNIENRIDLKENFPVDIVYTWVNDNDPVWKNKKERYSDINLACINSNDNARFENHNELYYSILSVKKNLPWVRKIFIITDNQTPEWLVKDEKIEIIDHSEIIDSRFLPTFNSHVIEANLYKIKDLAEHFIYFNDDVFVAKPLNKEHFFRKNGVISIFTSDKSLQGMKNRGVATATLLASENCNEILNKSYGISIDVPLSHTYVPLKKTNFKKCFELYEKEISEFLNNKFRGKNDLNMATFLVPWSIYLEGQSVFTSEICYYFNVRSNNALNMYIKLLQAKKNGKIPHSFCANDFTSKKSTISFDVKKNLELFLKTFFEE